MRKHFSICVYIYIYICIAFTLLSDKWSEGTEARVIFVFSKRMSLRSHRRTGKKYIFRGVYVYIYTHCRCKNRKRSFSSRFYGICIEIFFAVHYSSSDEKMLSKDKDLYLRSIHMYKVEYSYEKISLRFFLFFNSNSVL